MKTKRFLFDKLARDKVEDILQSEGATVKSHRVEDNEEYLDVLTQKMVEELEEIFDCETKEQVIEELADFQEVMVAFKKLINVTEEEVKTVQDKKRAEKGGFEGRLYLEYVEIPEGTPAYDYCMNDPEKYPEIIEEITEGEK